jgi:membrane protein required for colicin V production
MQTIDWIMIAIVGLGAVVGFSKGFIRQLASVVGLVAGLLVARALYASVGEKLAMETGTSLTFARGLAFLLIWLVVPVGLSLAATLLTKAVDSIHLGFVNRWLGAGLGALKYILLISLVIALIEYIDSLIQSTKKKESVLYYSMESLSGVFIPVIKDATKQLIDTDICNKNPINM